MDMDMDMYALILSHTSPQYCCICVLIRMHICPHILVLLHICGSNAGASQDQAAGPNQLHKKKNRNAAHLKIQRLEVDLKDVKRVL